jgi:hypothetical protein
MSTDNNTASATRELELLDALRVSHALLTMRIGLKAVDGREWRRKFSVRFRLALLEIQGRIRLEGRENGLINELVDQAQHDEWFAVKEAERYLDHLLVH